MQFHILDFVIDHFTSQPFNYSDTTLRHETEETLASLPTTSILKGCDTYEELVGL